MLDQGCLPVLSASLFILFTKEPKGLPSHGKMPEQLKEWILDKLFCCEMWRRSMGTEKHQDMNALGILLRHVHLGKNKGINCLILALSHTSGENVHATPQM